MVQAMTTHRKMHLVAFLLAGPTAHHHGAWRHPEADLGFFTPEWHEHIARVLEQGKFDSLFFADILGLYQISTAAASPPSCAAAARWGCSIRSRCCRSCRA